MIEMTWECISCGKRFGTRMQRCDGCWSPDVFSLDEIQTLVEQTGEMIEETILGVIPIVDALATVLKTRGIRLAPISTMHLTMRIWNEVVDRGRRV